MAQLPQREGRPLAGMSVGGAAARKILVHYHLDAACCKPHALFHLWSNSAHSPAEPREVRPEWAFWDASCNVRVLGVHLELSFSSGGTVGPWGPSQWGSVLALGKVPCVPSEDTPPPSSEILLGLCASPPGSEIS